MIKSSRRPSVYWRKHSGGKNWNYDCIVVFLMSISTLVDKLIITLCNSDFFLKKKKKCQLKTRSLNILSTFIKKFSPPIATAIAINIVLTLFIDFWISGQKVCSWFWFPGLPNWAEAHATVQYSDCPCLFMQCVFYQLQLLSKTCLVHLKKNILCFLL